MTSTRPHVLSGHDNDSYAFYDRDDVRRCPACANLTHKWEESLEGLRIRKRRKFDISSTYDGVLVVSERFRQVCEDTGVVGIDFRPLPNDPAFFAIFSQLVVALDAVQSMTRFEKLCTVCGQYDVVVGPYVVLKRNEIVHPMGVVRTDVEFAAHDEKHPIIVCGCDVVRILKGSGLRGLEIDEIVHIGTIR